MQDSGYVARILVIAGTVLVLIGLAVGILGRFVRLGHLPGDISFRRGNFTFFFPLATCLLLSLVLTAIAWLWRRR